VIDGKLQLKHASAAKKRDMNKWCILHIATCNWLAALPAIKESFLRSERVGKDKRS